MKQFQIPNSSSESMFVITRNITSELNETAVRIAKLGGIKSRVISIIHEFVTDVDSRGFVSNAGPETLIKFINFGSSGGTDRII